MKYHQKRKFFILLLLLNFSVMAEIVPHPYAADPRNTWVRYEPHQVINLTLPFNEDLTIFFGDDEQIQPSSSAGASSEIKIAPILPGAHVLTLQVVGDDTPANLTIITNVNTYTFHIQGDPNAPPMYTLTFLYPNKDVTVQNGSADHLVATGTKVNQNYWYAGDVDLLPTAAWDDGVFTYFQFGDHTPIPAVFTVLDAAGNEQLNNHYMKDSNTLVIEDISREFTLRLGDSWVAVLNGSYHNDANT
jgi:type IV secretion system protein VirB9